MDPKTATKKKCKMQVWTHKTQSYAEFLQTKSSRLHLDKLCTGLRHQVFRFNPPSMNSSLQQARTRDQFSAFGELNNMFNNLTLRSVYGTYLVISENSKYVEFRVGRKPLAFSHASYHACYKGSMAQACWIEVAGEIWLKTFCSHCHGDLILLTGDGNEPSYRLKFNSSWIMIWWFAQCTNQQQTGFWFVQDWAPKTFKRVSSEGKSHKRAQR